MRETTQGSKHKLYGYKCKRIKYDTPVERAGGIKFHYYNKCTRVRIPTEKCEKSHKSSGRMKGFRHNRTIKGSSSRSSSPSKTSHTQKSHTQKSHSKSHTKKTMMNKLMSKFM